MYMCSVFRMIGLVTQIMDRKTLHCVANSDATTPNIVCFTDVHVIIVRRCSCHHYMQMFISSLCANIHVIMVCRCSWHYSMQMFMSSLYAMQMFMLSLYADVNVINVGHADVHVIIVCSC